MKKVVLMVLTCLLLSLFVGCGASKPECASSDTKKLVLKVIDDQFKEMGGNIKYSAKLESIKTENVDKESGECFCTANVLLKVAGNEDKVPITYTAEIKGDELRVTVYGL